MTTSPEDPDEVPLIPDDPSEQPSDAGMPTDPNLDDDNVVVTPPDADGVPGSAAG